MGSRLVYKYYSILDERDVRFVEEWRISFWGSPARSPFRLHPGLQDSRNFLSIHEI